MNQIFTAGAAFLVILCLLGLGRKPKKFFSLLKETPIPIAKNELVDSSNKDKSIEKVHHENDYSKWIPPTNPKDRMDLRKKLFRYIQLGPIERMYAVQIANKWADVSLLPILRRGLKDSDSRIVVCSAEGISRFRSISKDRKPQTSSRAPRNVFLMR